MTAEPLPVEVERPESITPQTHETTGDLWLMLSARRRRHYRRSSFKGTR